MPYFTSWDVNVFFCLITLGLPLDLAKDMTKKIKKVHEKFFEDKTRDWYCEISPSLLYKTSLPNEWCFTTLAKTNRKYMDEFKLAWKWRCPEIRRDLISRMNGGIEIQRLKHEFDPYNGRYRIDSEGELPLPGRYHSSEGLWDIWSAWGNYHNIEHLKEHVDSICAGGNGILKVDRRRFVANWYRNIHEGRYFLFFRENNLTGYGKRKSKNIKLFEKVRRFVSIYNIGPYQQMAEDLLVIDGPGLGKSGEKIEHIDDYFL